MYQDQVDFLKSGLQEQTSIGILIGRPGSGKNKLIATLCSESNIVFKIQEADFQNFRSIRLQQGSIQLQLIQTSGYEAYQIQDFLKQSKIFFENLNGLFLNSIFIVCKYDREANMRDNIDKCYYPFIKYSSIISIIITWEKSDYPLIKQENIEKLFMNMYDIKKVIFADTQTRILFEKIVEAQYAPIQLDLRTTILDQKVDPTMLKQINDMFEEQFQQPDPQPNPENNWWKVLPILIIPVYLIIRHFL